MAKKCEREGCTAEIDEKYHFCYNHYNTGKTTDLKSSGGSWHNDPVVDQLMKLNANIGKMALSLDKMAKVMEWEQARNTDKEHQTVRPTEIKGMKRTKDALLDDDEFEDDV